MSARRIWEEWSADSYQCDVCGEICHVPSGCNGPATQEQIFAAFFAGHANCKREQRKAFEFIEPADAAL